MSLLPWECSFTEPLLWFLTVCVGELAQCLLVKEINHLGVFIPALLLFYK